MGRRSLRTAALGAAVLSVIGLAGCAGAPNTVAQVGAERITAGELRQQVTDVSEVLGAQPGTVSGPTIAQLLVIGEVAEQTATAEGWQVTPEQRRQFRAAVAQQAQGVTELAADPRTADFADAWVAPAMYAELVGPQELQRASQQIPVELNPAYGTWDPLSLTVVGDGSLSVSLPLVP